MTDTARLDDERNVLLDDIEKADNEIASFERVMRAGEASLERGLPYLADLQQNRADLFRSLGRVEAQIEQAVQLRQEKQDQHQEAQDDKKWAAKPEVVDRPAKTDQSEWWDKQEAVAHDSVSLDRQDRRVRAEDAMIAEMERDDWWDTADGNAGREEPGEEPDRYKR